MQRFPNHKSCISVFLFELKEISLKLNENCLIYVQRIN